MSIKLDCPQCSRTYTVRDELAGKKFRCKDCQAAVSVPAAEEVLVAAVVEDEDPFAQDEDFEPAPRRERSAPKRKGKRKKKSDGAGTAAIKTLVTIGLVVLGLGVVGAVLGGVIYGVTQMTATAPQKNPVGKKAPASPSSDKNPTAGAPVAWGDFTTPDGRVTVSLPGPAGPVERENPGPDDAAFGVVRDGWMMSVRVELLDARARQRSDEELISRARSRFEPIVKPGTFQERQVNGRTVAEFQEERDGNHYWCRVAVMSGTTYALEYGSPTNQLSADGERFLNSLRINR